MTAAGPLPVTSGTQVDYSTGSSTWSNADYIESDDTVAALADFYSGPSSYLKATGFGFSIPTGATILGITVRWRRYDMLGGSNITDASVRLVKAGTVVGTDKAIGGAWPSSATVQDYGGSADVWGVSWTAEDINDPDFGAVLSADRAGSGIAGVEFCTIEVEYSQEIKCGFTGTATTSGYMTADALYDWTMEAVSGDDLFLRVDVHIFGDAEVESVTYNGDALSFIGFGVSSGDELRVECWGLVNPDVGTHDIEVTLSDAVDSIAHAAQYRGVCQWRPTEAFNTATATNSGSPINASVTITSITDECNILASCITDDTDVTAVQTSRNNVNGTSGSAVQEDLNDNLSPAGGQVMSVTGLSTTAQWLIVGYALRPFDAPIILDASITQEADSLTADTTLAIAATNSFTQDDESTEIAATSLIAAECNVTADDETLSSDATLPIVIDLSLTLDDDTISSLFDATIVTCLITEEGDSVSSSVTSAIVVDADIVTEDDANTSAVTSVIQVDGAISAGDDALTSTLAVQIAANGTAAQSADSVSAEVGSNIGLVVSFVQAGNAVTAEVLSSTAINMSWTQANHVAMSTATITSVIDANITAGNDTLVSAGKLPATGAGVIAQAGDTATIRCGTLIKISFNHQAEGDTVSATMSGGVINCTFTQAGDSVLADATNAIESAANLTESNQGVLIAATSAIEADATPSLAGDTVVSSTRSAVSIDSSTTNASDAVTSAATSRIRAVATHAAESDVVELDATLDIKAIANFQTSSNVVTSAATLEAVGSGGIAQQGDSAAATGSSSIVASSEFTETDQVVAIAATSRLRVVAPIVQSSDSVAFEVTSRIVANASALQESQSISADVGNSISVSAESTAADEAVTATCTLLVGDTNLFRSRIFRSSVVRRALSKG